MVKKELERFLRDLLTENVTSGVKKIANLVFDHFDELEPLGTAQSLRAKKIVALASGGWEGFSDVINESETETGDEEVNLKQLKSIRLGPFRGFSQEEILDLYSQIVLIYGANGTGKSSFCEALEFGLLGAVEEVNSKRLTPEQYFKNAYVDRFIPPVIQGVNDNNEVIDVSPNEELYRFCFVEKNRIDSFSRIAAQSPAKQTELISSLFGLESFNEFVKNFTRELDARHIDLVGEKGQLLKKEREGLAVHFEAIKENRQFLKNLAEEELKLAESFQRDISFDRMLDILGSDENPGEIQFLDNELQKKQPSITGLSISALEETRLKVESTFEALNNYSAKIAMVSEGLSYKRLYGAVLDLKEASIDECPACKTPIDQVSKNPYHLASSELKKLAHLSSLEVHKANAETEFLSALKDIHSILITCVKQGALSENPLSVYLELSTDFDWSWWEGLVLESEDEGAYWELVVEQVKALELRDAEVKAFNSQRDSKQARLKELRGFKDQAIKLQTRKEAYNDVVIKALSVIKGFDEEHKELIAEVEAEKAVIETNKQIATSYTDFTNMLIDYNRKLPGKLVADLGELVVQLYNSFNRHDDWTDQLANIKLPLASGERIQISYRHEPENFFDALHVLSEGHIRCIGLSILLAKNLKTNSPFLIFDDPVNAIDDEHRKAIRATLYQDEFFLKKQIILACHGEEFLKNIHQDIGKQAAKESATYKFLPQRGESHIQVASFSCPPNYVLAATTYLEAAEYRNALSSARRALEGLTEKAWFHYNKHCHKTDGLISISKRSPDSPHDLRVLVENLKAKILKSKVETPSKDEIVDAFDVLLGVNGQDPHWLYLNKGTHEEEDRDEFEFDTVRVIIASLNQLDEALGASKL